MDAAIFYPVGIGKHIVCIYKQLVGENPEPPNLTKERIKQRTTTKQK